MKNITLSLDDTTVQRAQRIASQRATTLAAMIQEYLEQVAADDLSGREQRVQDIRASFQMLSRELGGKDWNRDELYD